MSASSGTSRALRHPLAPLLLVVAATIALPGRFLRDPVLLDSLSIRVKVRVLSLGELFDPAQTQVANPYYRPLFAALSRASDFLPGGADLGERLLALACHVFAALALFRLARALRLRRGVALAGLLLFLLAPANLTTVAWPIVAYWTLAAGLTWLAAAELVEFTARGGFLRALRAFLFVSASLFSSETGYHLVALLPLLALVPPRAGSRRLRPLALWPLFALLAFLHFKFCEPGASGLVTTAPLDRVTTALTAWPRYLEGALGGDGQSGARPLAWVALALLLVGVGRSRKRRFLVLAALAAAFPFAALGHTDRYAYFSYGPVALAFAACAPRGLVKLLRAKLTRARFRVASAALVALLVLVQALELRPRLAALELAGRETAQLNADFAPIAPKLADVDRVAFVNCPATLKWAVYDALPLERPEQLKPLLMANALCTRDGYFAPVALDFTPLGRTLVVECDGGRLVERAPAQPLGARQPLPWVFLAGGVDVVPHASGPFDGRLAEMRRLDDLLARTRALVDPLDHVIVEAPLPALDDSIGSTGALPREQLTWKLETMATADGGPPPPGLFGQQLVARVDVPRSAFLVAVTYLASEDPLRRVTGDVGRMSELLEATLDGQLVPIVPAFVQACGVVVPAGSHEVVLRMRPIGGKAFAEPSGR